MPRVTAGNIPLSKLDDDHQPSRERKTISHMPISFQVLLRDALRPFNDAVSVFVVLDFDIDTRGAGDLLLRLLLVVGGHGWGKEDGPRKGKVTDARVFIDEKIPLLDGEYDKLEPCLNTITHMDELLGEVPLSAKR